MKSEANLPVRVLFSTFNPFLPDESTCSILRIIVP